MFRETETLPSRFPTLKAGKGKATLDLVVVITCFPEVPHQYVPPSAKTQSMLRSSKSDQWKCYTDVEVGCVIVDSMLVGFRSGIAVWVLKIILFYKY